MQLNQLLRVRICPYCCRFAYSWVCCSFFSLYTVVLNVFKKSFKMSKMCLGNLFYLVFRDILNYAFLTFIIYYS